MGRLRSDPYGALSAEARTTCRGAPGAAEPTFATEPVAEPVAEPVTEGQIVFLEEIPKGATGKLQRIGLAGRLGL